LEKFRHIVDRGIVSFVYFRSNIAQRGRFQILKKACQEVPSHPKQAFKTKITLAYCTNTNQTSFSSQKKQT